MNEVSYLNALFSEFDRLSLANAALDVLAKIFLNPTGLVCLAVLTIALLYRWAMRPCLELGEDKATLAFVNISILAFGCQMLAQFR